MRIVVYAFTDTGKSLAHRLEESLRTQPLDEDWENPALVGEQEIQLCLEKESRKGLGEQFQTAGLMVFIGAAGIAVRMIAPYLKSKLTDPAVLVMDECAGYVIPILSGHFGGANAYARQIAQRMGAQEVITTATDLQGRFAVDVFARKNQLWIKEKELIQEISGAILRGEPVGFQTELGVKGSLPPGLVPDWTDSMERGIFVGYSMGCPFPKTLHLIPRDLILGVGCRRGKSYEELRSCLDRICEETREERQTWKHIRPERIAQLASIDLKAQEEGLLELARSLQVPFRTFCAEELKKVEGTFAASQFVESQTGVDNVCERSAALAVGGAYTWLRRKYAHNGITMAIARRTASLELAFDPDLRVGE